MATTGASTTSNPADGTQNLRSLIHVIPIPKWDGNKKKKKITGYTYNVRGWGLKQLLPLLREPSYECNFYLHNFKLILRSSHAPEYPSWNTRKNRSWILQKNRKNKRATNKTRDGQKKKDATENLSQKRINEIKLSLFRRNVSHWQRGWGNEGPCNAPPPFCVLRLFFFL